MPKKITQFTEETTLADGDLFTVVDISDSTMSTAGTNKIITAVNAANSIASKITSVPTIVSNALAAKANIAAPTFTGNVNLPSTTTIGDISSTELGYLNGVSSAIQTQLDGKAALTGATFSGTVTASTFAGNATTATTLQTARAIAVSGAVTGTANFNGSAAISISTTLADAVVSPAKLSTGGPSWNSGGTLSATAFSGPLTGAVTGTASGNIRQGTGTSQLTNIVSIGWSAASKLRVQVDSTDYAATWPIDIAGNAATATTATALAQPYTLRTAQASTSGTSIDFAGIPSWVNRITVMFNGVSTNGTSVIVIQLGDSGGIENTGYIAHSGVIQSSTAGSSDYTTGFGIANTNAAAYSHSGSIIFSLLENSTNSWVANGSVRQASNRIAFMAGSKSLSGVLDRVRITTVNGTDVFDAGSINISYE
jgi:hypothetical protein